MFCYTDVSGTLRHTHVRDVIARGTWPTDVVSYSYGRSTALELQGSWGTPHGASVPPLPEGITSFICAGAGLESLPALPSTLKALWCTGNKLTRLPALPPTLEELTCYDNNLEELPPLPRCLKRLDCRNNALTSLPHPIPTWLETIDCRNNKITTLNLTQKRPDVGAGAGDASGGIFTEQIARTLGGQIARTLGGLQYLFASGNPLTGHITLPDSVFVHDLSFKHHQTAASRSSAAAAATDASLSFTWSGGVSPGESSVATDLTGKETGATARMAAFSTSELDGPGPVFGADAPAKGDDTVDRLGTHVQCTACHQTFTTHRAMLRHEDRTPVCVKWKKLVAELAQPPELPAGSILDLLEELRGRLLCADATDRPLTCRWCEYTFTTTGNLNKHFRTSEACNKLAKNRLKAEAAAVATVDKS